MKAIRHVSTFVSEYKNGISGLEFVSPSEIAVSHTDANISFITLTKSHEIDGELEAKANRQLEARAATKLKTLTSGKCFIFSELVLVSSVSLF